MAQRTLVERLLAADVDRPNAPRISGEFADTSELLDSVLTNMRSVLNSRAGCCQIRPDYGMPDFNGLVGRFPDAIGIIANAVRAQVEEFEPRLSGITVRHVPDRSNPLRLAFRIHAALVVGDQVERLSFDTVLNNDGFVRVMG
ncbi:type VI secretion system baseplate subunit TssE [Azorhizobium sp. AG788]|uniref:type VI secretion system baseplate subunit TssE n=1 Tax=Azorhizobium sp. AG788 TaxID=2183897 RepID=UPI003139A72E